MLSLRNFADDLRRILRGDRPAPAETMPAAPAQQEFVRQYNRRGVEMPSGRFATMSQILVIDVLLSQDTNGLANMVKLASCVVAIDAVPLSLQDAFHMEVSEFTPIIRMLHAEFVDVDKLTKGFA